MHALGRRDTAYDNCSDEKVAFDHHLACTMKGGLGGSILWTYAKMCWEFQK